MKTFILSLLLTSTCVLLSVTAQPSGESASDYVADLSVPESPAFKLIEIDQSRILRPGTARDLVVSFSDFSGSNDGISVPELWAVEFSPGLLIDGKRLSIYRYRKRRLFYQTRLSAAVKRGQDGKLSELAAGLRVSLVDNSDLRMNEDIIKRITDLTTNLNEKAATGRTGAPRNDEESDVIVPSGVDSELARIKELRDSTWNKTAIDMAVAFKTTFKDSLLKNLRVHTLAFWGSFAFPLSVWGQGVVSANLAWEAAEGEKDKQLTVALPARFYVGSNRFKAYLEGQARKDVESDWNVSGSGGAEFRLRKAAWLNLKAGLEQNVETKEWTIVSEFSVSCSVTELFQ